MLVLQPHSRPTHSVSPQDCWAQGGYLAEVTSAEEEAALSEVINPDLQYWIGLNDEEQEGRRRNYVDHHHNILDGQL